MEIKLIKDRDLIDPNFSGYKLSLDGLVTRCQSVSGPLNVVPSASEYSYLHAKLFGDQNHLVSDPWDNQGDTTYFIGQDGQVLRQGFI